MQRRLDVTIQCFEWVCFFFVVGTAIWRWMMVVQEYAVRKCWPKSRKQETFQGRLRPILSMLLMTVLHDTRFFCLRQRREWAKSWWFEGSESLTVCSSRFRGVVSNLWVSAVGQAPSVSKFRAVVVRCSSTDGVSVQCFTRGLGQLFVARVVCRAWSCRLRSIVICRVVASALLAFLVRSEVLPVRYHTFVVNLSGLCVDFTCGMLFTWSTQWPMRTLTLPKRITSLAEEVER